MSALDIHPNRTPSPMRSRLTILAALLAFVALTCGPFFAARPTKVAGAPPAAGAPPPLARPHPSTPGAQGCPPRVPCLSGY